MKTIDFDYFLPPEAIAQTPLEPRDASRLLVLDRTGGEVQHCIFRDLGSHLKKGDLLVLNETRVIPARIFGRKHPTGGQVEFLLLKRQDALTWNVLVGGKHLRTGQVVSFDGGIQAEIIQTLEGSQRLVRFSEPAEALLSRAGNVPLPPYIHAVLKDPERYQTVYARQPGSAAAPTAGLHFTPELLDSLKEKGVQSVVVTLHVGLDTFAPVTEDVPEEHKIHTEWCQVTPEAADVINKTKRLGGRIIGVGTTSVRALESAARLAMDGDAVAPFEGATDLYILPGYQFRVVDMMITNFHLPRSTLIMLVSAFAGRERILQTYKIAIESGYRFYSFGDAMLIV